MFGLQDRPGGQVGGGTLPQHMAFVAGWDAVAYAQSGTYDPVQLGRLWGAWHAPSLHGVQALVDSLEFALVRPGITSLAQAT